MYCFSSVVVDVVWLWVRAVVSADVTEQTEKKSFEPTVSTTEAAQAQCGHGEPLDISQNI